jgi:curved DNA-binding protein CbpA
MTSTTFSNRDPYTVLSVERSADDGEIKRAYFRLVRQYPPEQEPEKFQEIRAAYELVRTAKDRAKMALFLLQPPPEMPKRRRTTYDLTLHRDELTALAREMALAR